MDTPVLAEQQILTKISSVRTLDADDKDGWLEGTRELSALNTTK